MMISEHVTYAEATKSIMATRYGINNTPNADQLELMRITANLVFEPVRQNFMKPIAVVSFFRSAELNELLKGAKDSQHMEGRAMDIDADRYGGLKNKQIFDYIRKYLDFDQLIGEVLMPDGDYQWVHVSYKNSTGNRGEILTSFRQENEMKYKKYAS